MKLLHPSRLLIPLIAVSPLWLEQSQAAAIVVEPVHNAVAGFMGSDLGHGLVVDFSRAGKDDPKPPHGDLALRPRAVAPINSEGTTIHLRNDTGLTITSLIWEILPPGQLPSGGTQPDVVFGDVNGDGKIGESSYFSNNRSGYNGKRSLIFEMGAIPPGAFFSDIKLSNPSLDRDDPSLQFLASVSYVAEGVIKKSGRAEVTSPTEGQRIPVGTDDTARVMVSGSGSILYEVFTDKVPITVAERSSLSFASSPEVTTRQVPAGSSREINFTKSLSSSVDLSPGKYGAEFTISISSSFGSFTESDSVGFVVTPEPSTIFLVSIGATCCIVGHLWRVRRRWRQCCNS